MFVPPRRAPQRTRSYLLAAFAIVAAGTLLVFGLSAGLSWLERRQGDEAAQERTAVAEMRSSLQQVRDRQGRIDTRPKANGPAGQAEAFFKRFAAQALADQVSYRTEIAALGFPDFLKPQRLATENLSAVLTKLRQAHGIVGRYRALSEQRVAEARASVSRLDLTDYQKSQLLAGMDSTAASAAIQRTQMWDFEEQMVEGYEGMVQVLARGRRDWRFSGGKLRFSNAGVMNSYNEQVLRVQALAGQEAALRNQALEKVDQRLSRAADEVP